MKEYRTRTYGELNAERYDVMYEESMALTASCAKVSPEMEDQNG